MVSWKDRLCGSIVTKNSGEEEVTSVKQLLSSNQMMSCGGGFFPVNLNNANMTTFKNNFILPTQKYSVLIFKNDGNAVIYSEEEDVVRSGSEVQTEDVQDRDN